MKAIIITFHGAFNSKNHEEDTLNAMIGCLANRTNTNVETITVSTFNDEEVHSILVKNNPTLAFKTKPKVSDVQRFCNAFVDIVGSPIMNSEDTLKKHFLAALAEGKFTPVRDVLPHIAEISISAEYAEDRRILSKHRLGFVPKYLNDINSIIKIF